MIAPGMPASACQGGGASIAQQAGDIQRQRQALQAKETAEMRMNAWPKEDAQRAAAIDRAAGLLQATDVPGLDQVQRSSAVVLVPADTKEVVSNALRGR